MYFLGDVKARHRGGEQKWENEETSSSSSSSKSGKCPPQPNVFHCSPALTSMYFALKAKGAWRWIGRETGLEGRTECSLFHNCCFKYAASSVHLYVCLNQTLVKASTSLPLMCDLQVMSLKCLFNSHWSHWNITFLTWAGLRFPDPMTSILATATRIICWMRCTNEG